MIRTNPFNKVPNEESQLHSQSIPPKKNYALNQNKNTFEQQPISSYQHYQDGALSETEMSKQEYDYIKQFNCSDEFINATTNVFPKNSVTLSGLSIPIGVTFSPLSPVISSEQIPSLDYQDKNIPRCVDCKAYMNPYIKFIDNGNKWECNICKAINSTDNDYYCPLDGSGQRIDKYEKPELCNGTYEYIASKSYWKKDRNPIQACIIFLIDVSLNAINSGSLNAVLESIKDAVSNVYFYNGENTKIGIITYDSSIHFYSFGKTLNQPQMLCVNDNEMFIPTIKDNLLLSINDGKDKIISIIELIQNSFTTSSIKDSTKLFYALDASYQILKGTGGKVVLFSSSNAINSISLLNSTEVKLNTQEQKMYTPSDNGKLKSLGIRLTNENISVDIFVFSEKTYINLLTLNEICDNSNGNIYFYKNFNLDIHYKNLFNQIRRLLSREIAYEAVLKTRISHGYTLQDFLTPVLRYNNELFVTPTIDSDQHYQVTVGFLQQDQIKENKTLNDNFVYFQCALLYSYGDGTRRIRIHNKCYPVSSRPLDIYNAVNAESMACWYTKKTINTIYKNKVIANSVIETETHFSTFISSMFSSQMTLKKELPDNLMYLPLYILGLIKQRVFCVNEIDKKYDIDLANYLRIKMLKLSAEELLSFLYPRIYCINKLIDDESLGTYSGNSFILPNIISTHYESFEDDGAYLIDNGYMLIVYIKQGINQRLLNLLFQVNTIEEIVFPLFEDKVFEILNPFKERLMNIVDYIRGNKSMFQNMIFIIEGSEGEKM